LTAQLYAIELPILSDFCRASICSLLKETKQVSLCLLTVDLIYPPMQKPYLDFEVSEHFLEVSNFTAYLKLYQLIVWMGTFYLLCGRVPVSFRHPNIQIQFLVLSIQGYPQF
jgi:hypothetical protein